MSEEVDPEVERLPALRAHKKALEEFLASPAHAGYVEACQREYLEIVTEIAEFEPRTKRDTIELYKLYGVKRERGTLADRFKVAYENLKTRIEELERKINT